ncbi:MAG: SIS domain-containing protein [Myxococcota bacterium]|nr:SIS domain-containing protein [Myxococcota bacterium]
MVKTGPAWDLVVEREEDAGVTRVRDALMELSRTAAIAAQTLPAQIAEAGAMCATSIRGGGKILACGNGGSAADAQHFVAELIGRMGMERPSLPAVSLTVDPSVVTCIANDYGYEQVFARQVHGLGRPGDVLVGLSTSGTSKNVLAALDAATERGLATIAIVGQSGSPAADLVLRAPSRHTARVQEIHTAALHAVCDVVEQLLFG